MPRHHRRARRRRDRRLHVPRLGERRAPEVLDAAQPEDDGVPGTAVVALQAGERHGALAVRSAVALLHRQRRPHLPRVERHGLDRVHRRH